MDFGYASAASEPWRREWRHVGRRSAQHHGRLRDTFLDPLSRRLGLGVLLSCNGISLRWRRRVEIGRCGGSRGVHDASQKEGAIFPAILGARGVRDTRGVSWDTWRIETMFTFPGHEAIESLLGFRRLGPRRVRVGRGQSSVVRGELRRGP